MIPLGDEKKSRTTPFLTFGLVVANCVVFGYQAYFSAQTFDSYVAKFSFVPSQAKPLTLLTSMFMHGGLLHLVGNVWFLWIFGKRIEDELGHFRYALFYVSMGCIATLTHLVMHPASKVSLIGASGAIAGVLGAYFIVSPFSRIKTLVPFFIIFATARVPAFIFLGLWFLIQLLQAKMGAPYVAWWAHIGGFVSGMLLVYFFKN